MSMTPDPVCDSCGADLSLQQWQLDWVIKYGNPVPRPPCPNNEDGLHRVSAEPLNDAE